MSLKEKPDGAPFVRFIFRETTRVGPYFSISHTANDERHYIMIL